MSEDLIRRSDAIKAINGVGWLEDAEYEERILAIPTIEPKTKVVAQVTFDEEKLREIVKRAVERFKEEYEIADRPQGEWIDRGWHGDWQFETDGRGNCWKEFECSECGFHNKGGKSNFCPNCGCAMAKEGE